MHSELEFSRNLRKAADGFLCTNFQKVSGSPGCPDLYLQPLGLAVGLWLELKVLRPKESRIKFQPNQSSWLSRRWEAGGASAVLTSVRGEELWLVEGWEAPMLEEARGLSKTLPNLSSLSILPSSLGSGKASLLKALEEIPRKRLIESLKAPPLHA